MMDDPRPYPLWVKRVAVTLAVLLVVAVIGGMLVY